jgi:hypothetical protein
MAGLSRRLRTIQSDLACVRQAAVCIRFQLRLRTKFGERSLTLNQLYGALYLSKYVVKTMFLFYRIFLRLIFPSRIQNCLIFTHFNVPMLTFCKVRNINYSLRYITNR